MQEASVLQLKAIFPLSIAPAGLRLGPHRQFKSTFPATSVTSPLISTVAEETEILQRWQTDDGDKKGNEESQEKGWAWRRNGRRGSGQTLGTDWGKHVYTGRGNCYQQVGGNQTSKIEGGQTEELRLRAGKKRCDEPPCRENCFPTPGEVLEVHPEQEAFKLWLGEKVACLGQGTSGGRKCLRAAIAPSTE